jgi:hypothetical protein
VTEYVCYARVHGIRRMWTWGKKQSGRLETDHPARVASTHNDTQALIKLVSGREHCEDTRKASALGGVFLDSAISHSITSE